MERRWHGAIVSDDDIRLCQTGGEQHFHFHVRCLGPVSKYAAKTLRSIWRSTKRNVREYRDGSNLIWLHLGGIFKILSFDTSDLGKTCSES